MTNTTLIAKHHVPGTSAYVAITEEPNTAGPFTVRLYDTTNVHAGKTGTAKDEASARKLANRYWIEYRDAARATKPPAPAIDVPAGRYAVEINGKLGFFKVDRPTEGRWAGYVFVKQMASDTEYPVRGFRRGAVLDVIAVDPQAASLRYGQEIGACGVCGRTLTDEDSRARGIGPICADKMGW